MAFPRLFLVGCLIGVSTALIAQSDPLMLANDEAYIMGDAGEDPLPDLNAYEALNKVLGGDSIRTCAGHPCIGWVEDRYADGVLKHKGYYDEGRLTVYKNYFPEGGLEREFRSIDDVKSILRTWHANGILRSETRFAHGDPYQYEDHYVNGQLRYAEERHRKEPCFMKMELYAADGKPVSLLRVVNKGKLEFEQQEFHPGGALRSQGRSQYDPLRMDSRRIGTWTHYDPAGLVVRSEDYTDGKVVAVR